MSEGTNNHSKELTDAQLTILDDFAYLKFEDRFKGQSVEEVVDYMLDEGLENNRNLDKIGKIGEYPVGRVSDTEHNKQALKSNSINQIHKRIVHTLPSCFYS